MTTKARLAAARVLIRGRSLRATPSRVAVLSLLCESGQAVSHADVVGRLSSRGWDAATLYRNLIDLAEVGLLRRTDVGDHVWRFEYVQADHRGEVHPHFVCTECGTVECLPQLELIARRARAHAPKAVVQRKIEVQLRGLCDTCG